MGVLLLFFKYLWSRFKLICSAHFKELVGLCLEIVFLILLLRFIPPIPCTEGKQYSLDGKPN